MTLFDLPEPDPPTARPDGPTARVRLVVAYDGSAFRGFAANEGVTTVGGTLTEALTTVLAHPVEITCAGRTDKGVHARAQVVTFDADARRVDPVLLMKSLNAMCGPTIAVTDVAVVPDDFDARFSAVGRRYRYRVVNRTAPDPFTSTTSSRGRP